MSGDRIDADEWILLVVTLLVGVSIGWVGGTKTERGRKEVEAVKAGHAEYSTSTGEWQWKDDNTGGREP